MVFSAGPVAMYQSLLILAPRLDQTLKAAIDEAFGHPAQNYSVVIVPEPATGHMEHDGSIFSAGSENHLSHPDAGPGEHSHPGHSALDH